VQRNINPLDGPYLHVADTLAQEALKLGALRQRLHVGRAGLAQVAALGFQYLAQPPHLVLPLVRVAPCRLAQRGRRLRRLAAHTGRERARSAKARGAGGRRAHAVAQRSVRGAGRAWLGLCVRVCV
jgi:hypothetical protein